MSQDRAPIASMLLVADMAYRNARRHLAGLENMIDSLEKERLRAVELATTLITTDHDPAHDSTALAAWTSKVRQMIFLADSVREDAAHLAQTYNRVTEMSRSIVEAFGVRCRSCGEMAEVLHDSWYNLEPGCLRFLCATCATCVVSECHQLHVEHNPTVWVVKSDDPEQPQLYCEKHDDMIPKDKVTRQSALIRIYGFKHWDHLTVPGFEEDY